MTVLTACVYCGHRIKPGQLYLPRALYCRHLPGGAVATYIGPAHVACPNEREVAHAQRMGREP